MEGKVERQLKEQIVADTSSNYCKKSSVKTSTPDEIQIAM